MESFIFYPFVKVFEMLDDLPIASQCGAFFAAIFVFGLALYIVGAID